jgi:hypothetical protein
MINGSCVAISYRTDKKFEAGRKSSGLVAVLPLIIQNIGGSFYSISPNSK